MSVGLEVLTPIYIVVLIFFFAEKVHIGTFKEFAYENTVV